MFLLSFLRPSILGNSGRLLLKSARKCSFPNSMRGFSAVAAEALKRPSVVHAIPALRDNYMYVLVDHTERVALAVDPVEPAKVLDIVQRENVVLTTVLTTHHHFDHDGGNEQIKKAVPFVEIYGGDSRISSLSQNVNHGATFKVGSLTVECLFTPCHTRGHMSYFVKGENAEPICFTGDTLFVAGCGRFFEGGAEQMLSALKILTNLPHHTKIYCGHEYTVGNLKFAVEVEPSNLSAAEKLSWAIARRDAYKPTVPSTIGEELKYNPFLRVREAEVQDYTKQTDPVKVMEALRLAKDNFIPV